MSGEIRIAIMLNDHLVYKWQKEALDHISELGYCRPVLRIVKKAEGKIPQRKPSFLYRLFRKITSPVALHREPLPEEWTNTDILECSPQLNEKKRELFNADDINRIKAFDPHVILRFGFNILSGEILNLPAYGVWSFHHGDPFRYRGGPPLFWEFYSNEYTAGSVLQRLTEKLDSGRILKQGVFSIQKHSFKTSLNQLLFTSSLWPAQILKDFYNNVDEAGTGKAVYSEAKVFSWPSNSEALKVLSGLLLNRIKFYFSRYFRSEDWNAGLLMTTMDSIITGERIPSPEWFQINKASGFIADPFSYELNGVSYLLYEEFDFNKGRGIICRNRLLSPERESEQVLSGDIHRSYPYCFSHGKKNFVVTESVATDKITLYSITDENRLRYEADLLTGVQAADPSIIHYNGLWWLFFTSCKNDGANRDLYLYYSTNAEGPYQAHNNNPVLSDVRYARPAGTMTVSNGELYRPVQDSSKGYGSAVHIMKVTKLDKNNFNQESVRTILPFKDSKFNKGIHTLSVAGNHVLVDGKRIKFSFSALLFQIRKKFSGKRSA